MIVERRFEQKLVLCLHFFEKKNLRVLEKNPPALSLLVLDISKWAMLGIHVTRSWVVVVGRPNRKSPRARYRTVGSGATNSTPWKSDRRLVGSFLFKTRFVPFDCRRLLLSISSGEP